MNGKPGFLAVMLAALLLAERCTYGFDDDFGGSTSEEPAGTSWAALVGPDAGVYGVSFSEGTRLKGTPIFGDLSISFFQNDSAESFFSSIGITIRVMPRWNLAPFVGAGGSFNYAWSSARVSGASSSIPAQVIVQEAVRPESRSYWGGHAEAGARLTIESKVRMIEVFGRYTWSSSGLSGNYWLVGVSTGLGW